MRDREASRAESRPTGRRHIASETRETPPGSGVKKPFVQVAPNVFVDTRSGRIIII